MSLLARWRWLWLLALIAILVVALLPPGDGAPWFRHVDKLQHLAAFVLLWMLALRARLGGALLTGLLLLGFGVLIELAQSLTNYRDASVADVGADLAGIALGWVLQRKA